MKPISVIGGCNIDISATSLDALVSCDSNPGQVRVSLGGVGRNIAENLSRLNHRIYFLSALGGDQFTELIKRHAQAADFDVDLCNYDETLQNSIYVCVNRPDGEMSVAVSDMRVCETITPEYLKRMLPYINCSSAAVVDANIPEESVRFIAEHCEVPICADTVSSRKASRLLPLLPRLEMLKTNSIEAQRLTGIEIHSHDDIRACAERLHEMGVKRVLFTLGADGAFAYDGAACVSMPSMTRDIVNTTGCGDSFFAGAINAWLKNEPIETILRYGLGMAALCAKDFGAVNQTVSPSVLEGFLAENG